MGYLREKYGEPDQIDSKFVKFTKEGQVYRGTVARFEEGKYGTDVIFTDDKVVTLNNAVLTREVVRADPEKGDVLEITYIGDEPGSGGAARNPTKLYKVVKNGGNGKEPAPAPDTADEPF